MASSLLNYIGGPIPSNQDPFGLNIPSTLGPTYLPITPAAPSSTGFVNAYPGSTIMPPQGQNFSFNTKQDADAYNAWLWNQSGGQSGAPMPPPMAEDPRLAQSRAYNQMVTAYRTPVAGGGNLINYNANPIVRRVLGGTGPTISYGTPTTSSGNPTLIKPGLTTTVKSPAQQGRLNANVAQFSTGPVAAAKANSLTQFTQDFIDQRAKDKAALGQENSFIGKTYDAGGLESDLASNAKQSALLGRQAVEAAIRRAGRDASISRMVNGGVNSSYLDRANTDVLSRLLLDQAQKNSALGRDNITYLQGQRSGLLGTRAKLGQDYVNNALFPYDRLTSLQSNDLGNLGRIGNIEDNNTLYDYVTPDQAANRNLGMLSDLEQTRLRYGL